MDYRIALIPGDGIGKEVVPQAVTVLDHLAERFGFQFEYTEFDYSCERYLKHGDFMPKDGLEGLKQFDAIFLGAVGDPRVSDHLSLWELLIPIRRQMHQYGNIRPVKLLQGVTSPLSGRGPGDIDFIVVRENN